MELIKGDIRDASLVKQVVKGVDLVIHAAAQTAVTTSLIYPEPDFSTNALGTFYLLEGIRKAKVKPIIIYCSTNKVYGENVNRIKVKEEKTRYCFEKRFKKGIPENFPIDLCEHTPYGCSKLAGDLYMQDYAHLYGLKIGVFRMSCIYGPRQFGVEDQGWVAWFVIAGLLNQPITIYGDGKQVRDLLYVDDLIEGYDAFVKSNLKHAVFNIGGGPNNTISLLEFLDLLQKETGTRMKISFSDWRPSDQKVYIFDIAKVKDGLNWQPKVSVSDGVKRLIKWAKENKSLF